MTDRASEHLSEQLIELYRQRRLEPAELLAMDDHVMACVNCQQQFRAALSVAFDAVHLQNNLLAVHAEARDHLSENQLHSFLTKQLDAVDGELAESHLEFCASCQARVSELQQTARAADQPVGSFANVKPASETWRGRFLPNWLQGFSGEFSMPLALRFAGALGLLALLVWGVIRWRTSSGTSQQLAGGASPTPTVERTPPPSSIPLAPTVVLALNDGGQSVTLDANGNVLGIESFSAADQQAVKNALLSGKIETPPALAELKGKADVLMGGTESDPGKLWAASAGSTLLTPFAEIVAEDRPVMKWKPLASAESYVVTISDLLANYREIAISPKLSATNWRPARPLPRGRSYVWQVTATIKDSNGGNREITAPLPEAPEAKFRILTQTQADELAQGREVYAGRPLPLSLLYARIGLLKDAERELQVLAASNPKDSIVQELLRNLRAKRQELKPSK